MDLNATIKCVVASICLLLNYRLLAWSTTDFAARRAQLKEYHGLVETDKAIEALLKLNPNSLKLLVPNPASHNLMRLAPNMAGGVKGTRRE